MAKLEEIQEQWAREEAEEYRVYLASLLPLEKAVHDRWIATEGWTWLVGARKVHYVRAGRTLCKRWRPLGHPALEQGGDDNANKCVACRRILEAERSEEG